MAKNNRYFVKITKDKLRELIEEQFDFDPREMQEKLGKDFKVSVDFENFDCDRGGCGPQGLMGIVYLDNGLTFAGCCAGGDWQFPVFWIIYYDGKKLRAYFPTEGNPWNTTTKSAYGDDEEADKKNAKKRYPERFEEEDWEFAVDDFQFDAQKIRNDIMTRLLKK